MNYTNEQIKLALSLFASTQSPKKVISILGFPSGPMLYKWRLQYPEYYRATIKRRYKHPNLELKRQAIERCLIGGESIMQVANDIGYSYSNVYRWCIKYQKKGLTAFMTQKKPDELLDGQDDVSAENIEEMKIQMQNMQMEIDILRETINVLKKDQGIDWIALNNKEKTVIIDALKDKYSLSKLCKAVDLPRSSYYYQKVCSNTEDKYKHIRNRITQLFHENMESFGYRRINILLHREGIFLSEKVIRKIMKQEGLIVRCKKSRKYNSYKGEISVAPDNLIKRNFHAEKPNEKWLTDITEFSIKAGIVYLSPIIDCLDGMPVSWTIGTSPNAELVNTMLIDAIKTLHRDEKPIVHSDRGCHYRWPGWIKIMEENGLIRSMSKKGCSPDNSACEGFFGRLKTEMFYGRNWDKHTINDFIAELNSYMNWYRNDRIKSTLGGLSPLEYRRRLGITV